MEVIENLIFGEPVYDCKGRMIRRNFGIKNALVIILIVYGLYSLRGKMAIKSGRRKLRGGGDKEGVSDKEGEGSGDSNSKGLTIWDKIKWKEIKWGLTTGIPWMTFWSLVIILVIITVLHGVFYYGSSKKVKLWLMIWKKIFG